MTSCGFDRHKTARPHSWLEQQDSESVVIHQEPIQKGLTCHFHPNSSKADISCQYHIQVERNRAEDRGTFFARAKSREAKRVNDSLVYLAGSHVFVCGECATHLTTQDDIISKSFHGRHGRAFLLDNCVNVSIGPSEDRRLLTGMHSVSDIFCKRCRTLLGWTYRRAYEPSQKYKEGKFIVEKIHLHAEQHGY